MDWILRRPFRVANFTHDRSHLAQRALRWGTILLVLVAAGLFVTDCILLWDLKVDDAYITFHYARNLADGHGIVWNIGEEPVEGYTTPLLVALLAPCFTLGLDPLLSVRFLSLVAQLIVVGTLFYAIRACGTPRESSYSHLSLWVPALWFSFQPNVIHTLSGMETSITLGLYASYTMTVSVVAEQQKRGVRVHGAARSILWILAVCVSLVRSESIMISFAGVLVLLLYKESRKEGALLAGVIILFLSAYLVFKQSYFGYLLPNPYYVKMTSGQLAPGLWPTSTFLIRNAGWLTVLALGVHALRARWRELPPFAVMALVCLAGQLALSARVEHIMGFAHRFAWPAMPFLALLAIAAISSVAARSSRQATGLLVAVLVGAQIVQWAAWATYNPGEEKIRSLFFAKPSTNPFAYYQTNERIGRLLGDLDLPYSTTICANEAGFIPYFANTRSLDYVGLNDNVIAREDPATVRAYKQSNQVDIVYTVSQTGALDDFVWNFLFEAPNPHRGPAWSREILTQYARKYYYAGAFYWGASEQKQYFHLWVRKGMNDAPAVALYLRERADTYDPAALMHGPYASPPPLAAR